MAEVDTELMPIADVYAEALLSSADELGQADEVADQFDDLVAFMNKEPDFAVFLTSDSVDDDPRRLSLEKLFRGRINDLLLNLLQVLNNRGRIHLVREVQQCVADRMALRRCQQEVVVQTAVPLTDELREEIKKGIEQRTGKQALLVEKVNSALIGGLVIRLGDLQIDGSVATRIQSMRKRLHARAKEEIHEGRGYVAEA